MKNSEHQQDPVKANARRAPLTAPKRVEWRRKGLGAGSPLRFLALWGRGTEKGVGSVWEVVSEQEKEQQGWKWKDRQNI